MPKPRTTALAVAVSALTLATCSASSDDTTEITEPPAITELATTTESPPPSDPVDDTVATTTMTSTTTTSTSEPVPKTTQPSVEDQVRSAAFEAYDGYWECLRAPAECDASSRTLPGSPAFEASTAGYDQLVADGLFVGDEDPGYMVIESIEIKDDHTLVTSCWRLTGVLYLQPPIEGQPATVQNDTPGYARQTDEFVQDPLDEVWKIRRSENLEREADTNGCPPEES